MINLKFNALTIKYYRISILLIILAISIPASIFMFIVISNNIVNLKRHHIVLIMGFFGFISFLCFGIFTQKILSRKFELIFNQSDLLIISKSTETISYADIKTITIHNNTEYAKIIVEKTDGKKIKLFIGMANVLNSKSILEPANLLNAVLNNNFENDITNIKGIDIIKYKNKRNA